jgi:hydrocephalus-inducing protein
MMQTLLNPYEITRIAVAGEAFFEEIIFEGLPNDLEDEVIFGDCVINNERKVHFQVRNNGSNPIRFAWNTQGSEDFVFQPRLGHLAAGQSKPI